MRHLVRSIKIRDSLYSAAAQTVSKVKYFRSLQSQLRWLSYGDLAMDPSNHTGQATDAKINILMVDDQPGKLLSYEASSAD